MDIELIIALFAGVVTLVSTAAAIAHHLTKNQQQFNMLERELQTLRDQDESIRTAVTKFSSTPSSSAYQDLTSASDEAAKTLLADVHSISVPASLEDPSHLRIIHSSDIKSAQIQGMEFPIVRSIAGWVFLNQEPYIKNDYADDRHFEGIDKATGVRTGAMLTMPLVSGRRCYGVVQFIKQKGGTFDEGDINLASRYIPAIARRVIDLEENTQEDIPTIPRGHTVRGAILFSDIRAFSYIPRNTSHNVTVRLLNEYYSRLIPPAISRRGTLQEYVGDGLYISFILDSPAASVRAAVSSALEMQKEFDSIIKGWRDYGHSVSPDNTHGIGIAAGSLYSGLIGYQKERQEKLVGPPINAAAHLCAEAKNMAGGGILVDEECYKLLSGEGYDMRFFKGHQSDICYRIMEY